MKSYEIMNEKFILNDYQNFKKFSSFLPAIAGEKGKPMWVFYANVGQCVGGFGVDNKEGAFSPFDSAFMAYQNISLKSFRTFLDIDGISYYPFSLKTKNKLIIEKSQISIIEDTDLYTLVISYSTVSNKDYPGLIRKVTITNKGGKHNYKILDGLPTFLPKGLGNYSYHNLTTLMSAYCQSDLNESAPYCRFVGGEDEAKITLKESGNGYISIDQYGNRLTPVVDLDCIFGEFSCLITPLSFTEIIKNIDKQNTCNKIPCAFSFSSVNLLENETYSFITLFTTSASKNEFNNIIKELSFPLLNNMFEETSSLVNSLLPEIKTSSSQLNQYIKQCYLDNGLRGGFPHIIDDKILYLYSRKHGDMERDYNDFSIPSTYFSSGLGNYRDINQNRRNDLYISPKISDFNIFLFENLIELNGFNPLLVDVSILDKKYGSYKEALDYIASIKSTYPKATFKEGYWIDHWTYNTDLIENYLSIYPDKIDELMLTKKYRFFDSGIRIKPRKERYVVQEDKVRQYHSIEPIKENLSTWLTDYSDIPVEVTLLSKLLSLIIVKYASLDSEQLGIEMYTDKPGWNDACNGLPGIFGSSMNETVELLRLVNLIIKVVEDNSYDVEVTYSIKKLFSQVCSITEKGFAFWDKANEYKEIFEDSYRKYTSLEHLQNNEIITYLSLIQLTLKEGINKAISIGNGIIPSYFTYDADNFSLNSSSEVKVSSFIRHTLPHFLETPARALKVDSSLVDPNKVMQSDLYDKKLKIFKTSESLEKESFEIGRIHSFIPGWLERESDFLHMTFKYLLGLLKAGYYKEFFALAKTNIPCFMDVDTYGRSTYENVSFIVTSSHPNKDLHGRGFYARLTGANTEIVEMVDIMLFGKKLFSYTRNELSFNICPHIPASLFSEKGIIKASLFSSIELIYINKNKKDYDKQNNISYEVDGAKMDKISSNLALKIRNQQVKRIIIHIN